MTTPRHRERVVFGDFELGADSRGHPELVVSYTDSKGKVRRYLWDEHMVKARETHTTIVEDGEEVCLIARVGRATDTKSMAALGSYLALLWVRDD